MKRNTLVISIMGIIVVSIFAFMVIPNLYYPEKNSSLGLQAQNMEKLDAAVSSAVKGESSAYAPGEAVTAGH